MNPAFLRGGYSLLLFIPFLILTASFSLNAASLEIIRPITKSVVDESEINVVVKVNDPEMSKVVFVDGTGREFHREIKKNKAIYCQSLKTKMGNNSISVVAYNGTDVKESKTVEVYFRSELFGGFNEEPSGYRKHSFHTEKDEQLCKKCHNMIPNAAKYVVPENGEDSTCYQCHKNLVNRAKSHAPSVNWLCTECHTGQSGEYNSGEGNSKFSAPDPIMERCFNCHENIKSVWFARKSEHGPVRDGRCNRCHNPHSSDELFFTRKPLWDLCTTCHSEKASGAHVISSFVRDKTHPTQGKPDPARPGRELVCSGCHDPHGSEGIFLLRSKGKTAFSVCVRCHQK